MIRRTPALLAVLFLASACGSQAPTQSEIYAESVRCFLAAAEYSAWLQFTHNAAGQARMERHGIALVVKMTAAGKEIGKSKDAVDAEIAANMDETSPKEKFYPYRFLGVTSEEDSDTMHLTDFAKQEIDHCGLKAVAAGHP